MKNTTKVNQAIYFKDVLPLEWKQKKICCVVGEVVLFFPWEIKNLWSSPNLIKTIFDCRRLH